MVDRKQLEPDATPPPKAKEVYSGTTVPVSVKATKKGDRFVLDLLVGTDLFDQEEYVSTSDGFFLATAAGETYDPPIPLLRFPLAVGSDTYTWSGKLSGELDPHPARATITSSQDSVTMGLSPDEAIRVNVDIVITPSPGEAPAERQLLFWFVPKKGVVKSQFGTLSTREPAS
ncbi:hypothetical protein [Fimbriimonas ginsengisoli]|uniref:Uncharacterized protein n=1 Tax=Fimbriimonas ginsengisoli Gsoil 348 TaxID=661478 RepID=A0A068NXR0_FIMGI|nr:hypothetical protein [Fimbriimonas ginsengisoli]AIE86429.1 hypothetical protein OP10G_3061 [Fimbriimonas ginsengisoli Gsoil 348]